MRPKDDNRKEIFEILSLKNQVLEKERKEGLENILQMQSQVQESKRIESDFLMESKNPRAEEEQKDGKQAEDTSTKKSQKTNTKKKVEQ